MYSTFNIPPDFKGQCSKRDHYGEELYNTYYQWVAIYLVIQALMVYTPRVLWLSLEGGLMKFLVRNARQKIIEDAGRREKASSRHSGNIFTINTPATPSCSFYASFSTCWWSSS